MVKKKVKKEEAKENPIPKIKKSSPKKSPSIPKTPSQEKIDKVLVENFVALQKIMANLSTRFDSLSTQISKLLNLFEESAKTLAEKESAPDARELNKELLEKLESISEQNKIISRTFAMPREQEFPKPMMRKIPSQQMSPSISNPRMPEVPRPQQLQKKAETNNYQSFMKKPSTKEIEPLVPATPDDEFEPTPEQPGSESYQDEEPEGEA